MTDRVLISAAQLAELMKSEPAVLIDTRDAAHFAEAHIPGAVNIRDIIRQVCAEMSVTIVSGALSRDHVHMFVEIPPHVRVCDFVRKAKGRSSRKIQQEFEHIRKRYWGQHFWVRGYFSTTSGNITDDVIMNNLDEHTVPSKSGFSPAT